MGVTRDSINTTSRSAMENLQRTNPEMKMSGLQLPSVANVLNSAAGLADTPAYAHGEGPGVSVGPEFVNAVSHSLNNNVAFGNPVSSSVTQQLIIDQYVTKVCAGLEGVFTENALSAGQKSENCPFLATHEARPQPKIGKSKNPFPTGRKFEQKIFTFFLPAGNLDKILLDIRLD